MQRGRKIQPIIGQRKSINRRSRNAEVLEGADKDIKTAHK